RLDRIVIDRGAAFHERVAQSGRDGPGREIDKPPVGRPGQAERPGLVPPVPRPLFLAAGRPPDEVGLHGPARRPAAKPRRRRQAAGAPTAVEIRVPEAHDGTTVFRLAADAEGARPGADGPGES